MMRKVISWLKKTYDDLGQLGLVTFLYFVVLGGGQMAFAVNNLEPWLFILLAFPLVASFSRPEDHESAIFTGNASLAIFIFVLFTILPFSAQEIAIVAFVLFLTGIISFVKLSSIPKRRAIKLILPILLVAVLLIVALELHMINGYFTNRSMSVLRIDIGLFFMLGLIGRNHNVPKNRYMLVLGFRYSSSRTDRVIFQKHFWMDQLFFAFFFSMFGIAVTFPKSSNDILMAVLHVETLLIFIFILFALEWWIFKEDAVSNPIPKS
ncbi:MAG: hypothetical protein D6732_21310 [Methanobacteriota archaeon]|nr:MAG: hypothetical protein D6732_21310 [Euryarchaeota archaeon]